MQNNELFIIKDGDLIGLKEEFSIPKETVRLEWGCFRECDFITKLNIGASCTVFPVGVFGELKNLEYISIDKDNEKYTSLDGCIYTKDQRELVRCPTGCKKETFYINDQVEIIGESAFGNTKSIENVYVGKGVRKIESDAFNGTNIEKIYIPPTVTEIATVPFNFDEYDGQCFYGTVIGGEMGSVIEEFCNKNDIPFVYVSEDNIDWFFSLSYEEHRKLIKERIKNETEYTVDFSNEGFVASFENGTLTISVPKGIQREAVVIGDINDKISEARRKKIKKVIIEKGITKISKDAFRKYSDLESLFIGKDVLEIEPKAFADTYSLKEITVDKENKHLVSIDNVVYTSDLKALVKYPAGSASKYFEVPSHVEVIKAYAFQYSSNLECVKISGGVNTIEEFAFFDCYGICHAYIDEGVTNIGNEFIFACEKDWYLCVCCADLIVGGKRGSAAERFFAKTIVSFCHVEDEELTDFLKTPIEFQRYFHQDPYYQRCTFAIIEDTLVKYKSYDKNVTIPQGVVTIGEEAFANSYVRSVIIPSGVKEIKRDAFLRAQSLKSVSLPDTLEFLGESAFEHCQSLESIYIPASLTAIGNRAFANCPKLYFTVDENNPEYCSIDGMLCTKNGEIVTHAKPKPEDTDLPF